jgi:hypothetical protein
VGAGEGDLVTFARDLLLAKMAAAKDRIWLASPFLTRSIAERIRRAAGKAAAADRKLLTALDARSVQVGALDPQALAILLGARFQIASVANLHAKVSLVDADWGLVGSGNLTGAGLGDRGGGNLELGVVLGDAQVQQSSVFFTEWWDEAVPVSTEEIARYEALPKIPKPPIADLGPTLGSLRVDELEQILAESPDVAASRHYWIDANYHSPDDEMWWHRGWISGPVQATYAIGDLIVIYLTGRDGGPESCPAVVRVARPCREDRRWVIDHRDEAAAKQWPFVTETEFVGQVPISRGVRLEVAGKTGQSVQIHCSITRTEFEAVARAMLARGA